jgi:hypothetical protein
MWCPHQTKPNLDIIPLHSMLGHPLNHNLLKFGDNIFPTRPDVVIWESWYIYNECETEEHVLTSLSLLSEFTSRLTFSSNIFSVSENSSAGSDGTYGTFFPHTSVYSNRSRNIHISNY